MSLFEVRNDCCVEECKTMNFSQDIGDILVVAVDGANPIHAVSLG